MTKASFLLSLVLPSLNLSHFWCLLQVMLALVFAGGGLRLFFELHFMYGQYSPFRHKALYFGLVVVALLS